MVIRVLHILNQLVLGGTEKQTITLFNKIDHNNFQISLFCFNPKLVDIDVLPERVDYYEYHRKTGIDFKIIKEIVRIVRKNSIDIIHSHNWGTLLYALLAARLTGCIHIHGEHGKEHFSDLPQKKRKRLIVKRISARFSDFFITVSEQLRDELVETWGVSTDKIVVISNGVDSTRFRPDSVARRCIRQELNVKDKEIVLGVVGWLRPIKNQATVIRVMPMLLRDFGDIKLLLVGDGEERSNLERLSHGTGVSSNVIFVGHRNDICDVLNAFDIYIQPSLFEGMSNTIMEAMAVGLPVVAMDVGGNCELVQDRVTGYLAPPDNSRELFQRLVVLVMDENKRKVMGYAGRKRMVQYFPVQSMIKTNEQLYIRLMENVQKHIG